MLSRLVRPSTSLIGNLASQQSASQAAVVRLVATSSSSTQSSASAVSQYQEGPERDLVNFPRPKRLEDTPKVHLGWVSENYFKFFYPKTGVSGGWTFTGGLLTFVLSKEIWVLEHEFYNGVSVFFILYILITRFGPGVKAWCLKEAKDFEDNMNAGKINDIEGCKSGIEEEKKSQWQAEAQPLLFQAKKENVAFQLEAAYRERLAEFHAEVKRRLDYQVAKIDVERSVQQKHMVNWIVSKVTKAITSGDEQETLKKCIADLKGLAVKA